MWRGDFGARMPDAINVCETDFMRSYDAFFTEVESIGRTSMKIHVEAWARRFETHLQEKVTDATFTFVAIDAAGKPRPIPREES